MSSSQSGWDISPSQYQLCDLGHMTSLLSPAHHVLVLKWGEQSTCLTNSPGGFNERKTKKVRHERLM